MGTISRVMSLAPIISLDFSRSNARGRSDLHRPKDAWTSLAHTSPEYCKIGAAGTQRRRLRLFVRTASFRLAATDSRGFGASRFVGASRSTGLAGRMRDYASPLQIRATTRVFRGSVDRQAPIFRQESEGGTRRRMRKQPGGESGWRCYLSKAPSDRAAGTYGARLGGSHHGLGNGGRCEVGEPAGALFNATARND